MVNYIIFVSPEHIDNPNSPSLDNVSSGYSSELKPVTVTGVNPKSLGSRMDNTNHPPEREISQASRNGEEMAHRIDEWLINMTPILGEANLISHIFLGNGLQDVQSDKKDDMMDRILMSVGAQSAIPRGMNNPSTKAALSKAILYITIS